MDWIGSSTLSPIVHSVLLCINSPEKITTKFYTRTSSTSELLCQATASNRIFPRRRARDSPVVTNSWPGLTFVSGDHREILKSVITNVLISISGIRLDPGYKAHGYKAIPDTWPILWWSQLRPCIVIMLGYKVISLIWPIFPFRSVEQLQVEHGELNKTIEQGNHWTRGNWTTVWLNKTQLIDY